MALVYAQISDPEVLRDYQAVLGPRRHDRRPCAAATEVRRAPRRARVDWLKTNFFKTELELGHCLRLPPKAPASATST